MDMPPRTQEYHYHDDYEQFVLGLMDEAHDLFARRGITAPIYDLTAPELHSVGPVLREHMIDPSDALRIKLIGRNPFTTIDAHRGRIWVTLRHHRIITEYDAIVSSFGNNPIKARKNTYEIATKVPLEGDLGSSELPDDTGIFILRDSIIGIDERHALIRVMRHL